MVTLFAISAIHADVQNVSTIHVEKLNKFNGTASKFKRWQQEMYFYLTTFNLARLVTKATPKIPDDNSNTPTCIAYEGWKQLDFFYCNDIWNSINDSLYNEYEKLKMIKELWEFMDRKHKYEHASSKKIMGFLNYVMIDSIFVYSQVQELQLIFPSGCTH